MFDISMCKNHSKQDVQCPHVLILYFHYKETTYSQTLFHWIVHTSKSILKWLFKKKFVIFFFTTPLSIK